VFIFTLARDRRSAKENKSNDKKREEGKHDKLSANSDFLSLWDPQKDDPGYFFSEDLRQEDTYESSSLNYWRNIEGNPYRTAQDEWPLWYRATIVWPIRQEPRDELGMNDYICLGFVTVDSRVPGAFDEYEHAPFGRILANSLFPVLELYGELSAVVAKPKSQEVA